MFLRYTRNAVRPISRSLGWAFLFSHTPTTKNEIRISGISNINCVSYRTGFETAFGCNRLRSPWICGSRTGSYKRSSRGNSRRRPKGIRPLGFNEYGPPFSLIHSTLTTIIISLHLGSWNRRDALHINACGPNPNTSNWDLG